MLIDKLFEKGARFLGSKYPIMCGAMTWVSDAKLISAIGEAGGFAFLAGGNAPCDVLEKEIAKVKEKTEKPFGVNLITIAPMYKEHLDLVCDLKCNVIAFAGTFPRDTEIAKAKDAGAKVLAFAPTEQLAAKLVKMGVDGLIIEGSEAGGHIGPVALSILIQQILFKIDDVPIFVAGGIATGKMMAHLLLMGAAGVQMGTRFVLAEECGAHHNFKEAFIKAKAKDASPTPQFDQRIPIIPVRTLKNQSTEAFCRLQLDLMNKLDQKALDRKAAQYETEKFWIGSLKDAVVDGNIEKGSLMAGQSVGLVDKIMPAKNIIDEMIKDAEYELEQIKIKLC